MARQTNPVSVEELVDGNVAVAVTEPEAPKSRKPVYTDGKFSISEAAAYLELTDMRMRTLLREGKVAATKTEKGVWRISQEDLDAYKNRTVTRQSNATTWTIRVPNQATEEVRAVLATLGVELKPRYSKKDK